MSEHYPRIQLRRSKLNYTTTKIKNTELEFGEVVFLETNNYLVIGGSDTSNKKISAQKLAKVYGSDIIDKSLFYQTVGAATSTIVNLINDQKQQLYLVSTGIKRTDGTSLESDLTNIWSAIDNLDQTKAPKKAPVFTKDGNTYPQSVTTNYYDDSTNIATTAFVNDVLDNTEFKKTGSSSSTKWVIPKTPATSGTIYVCGVASEDGALKYCNNASGTQNTNGVRINCATGVLFGAAWNDFAEFRECECPAGTVVCETGKGNLIASSERLQAGAAVVSDTYGMVIGINSMTSAPIAVAGRVLVFFSGTKRDYKPGDAVCAAENGKIAVMTRDEIKEYPDRILGYVSEIPSKKTWNKISTEGRIWIKIK